MKKITLFAIALLASVVSFAALNPYAYGLSSKLSADETTLTVNYSLNAPATAVNIVVLDGETTVKSFPCEGITKGAHTVELSTAEFPKTKSLTWKVEVSGASVANPTLHDESIRFYLPYGMDIDVDPESDYLGNWYVIEATNGGQSKSGYQSNPFGRGLYAFDAAMNPILNSAGTRGFTGGINVGATETNVNSDYVNFYRVATSGGRVFIGRFRDGASYHPIVEANPADLNATFTSVVTSGRAVSIDARGNGENLKLVMLGTDYKMYEYDLGTAKSIAAPSRTLDKTGLTVARDDASIAYDNNGGIWFNQNRAEAAAASPTIAHISASGVDYNNVSAGLSHLNTNNSGIAVSPDGKQLAVVGAGSKNITIYNINNTGGNITLTKAYSFAVSAGNNHTALAWDYAGNLFAANRSSERIRIFAMPYSGMVATPAASKYAFQLQGEVQGTFYTLTTNVDATMGEVTGNAGQYLEGTEAIITAVAYRGHKFLNWTVGEETRTENPLTLIINSDLTVTANFEALPAYTITATANDGAMGTITGAGTYYKGEEVTLKAVANTGHAFVDWSNGATEATLTFTATKDSTVQANFKVLSYTVALATNDEAKGTVSGAGTYEYGTKVELTATPADGYELLYWSDRSTENPRTITVDGNEALSAYFIKTYTQEPTFTIEKLWENAQVPAATGNGFQAVGWDEKIYMKDRLGAAINVYTATGSELYVNTDAFTSEDALKGDQPIAIDDAGNLIIRSGSGLFYNAPKQVTIYKNGEKTGKAIDFTLPASGRCDFISASGDIYSAEGGYVYFYCQNQTTVSRLYIKNGGASAADISVDKLDVSLTAGASQSHVFTNIFGGLMTHTRASVKVLQEVDVVAGTVSTMSLPTFKESTLGGCSFELGGKELIAYNIKGTDYSSEWNIYNMTDGKFLSDEVLYVVDKANSTNNAANWLNVQKVDEKTAYIYQFCPKKGAAVWKVTCDTGEEPENPTAVDNAIVAPQVEKIVRDGQVLIIRDGKTFNMMGQEVR